MATTTVTLPVRYGHSEGRAMLLTTRERGGAYFMHSTDPGFGPMAYAVPASGCTWLGEGHAVRFIYTPGAIPGENLTCECGWSTEPAPWADLRVALIGHLAPGDAAGA